MIRAVREGWDEGHRAHKPEVGASIYSCKTPAKQEDGHRLNPLNNELLEGMRGLWKAALRRPGLVTAPDPSLWKGRAVPKNTCRELL